MTLLLLLACNEYGFVGEPPVPYPDVAVLASAPEAGLCADEKVTVDVVNLGDAPLAVSEVRVDGAAWSFADLDVPFVLAPGGTHALVLDVWDGDATLVVTSDDPDEPVVEVPLSVVENVPPVATIVSPYEEDVLPADGDVTFTAFVSDDDDAIDTLAATWESSLTGAVGSSVIEPDGRVTLVLPADARVAGPQFMTLVVTDPCDTPGDAFVWYCQDGPYIVRPIEEEAWHYEGTASRDAGVLTLTDATDAVGAAFDLSSIFDGDEIALSFELQIEGGAGEGLAFTLLDAYRQDGYVGGDGCGLGFGGGADCTSGPGLPGWSLAIDTHTDPGDCLPVPHLAFTFDGDVTQFGPCSAIPDIADGAWHTLALRLSGEALVVTLDGVEVLADEVSGVTDFQGYVGFSATTTDSAATHRVRAVEVTDFTCE